MATNEPQHVTQSIATQLRMVRKSKGLSLDKTAGLTGVSKAMLGQIERGESSPTIATLWKIATGLKCSFSSFLTGARPPQLVSKHTVEDQFTNDPNMKVKTLFGYNVQTGFEVFELRLTDFHEQHSTAHQVGVTEHIHVTKGKLSVLEGETWREYNQGEQCLLYADQPHGYRDEVGETHFIAVIHYPQARLD
ncbi:XRE family transcriptional regulator [Alteromonas sp. D210916BOD_24]|uniref:helix-turn-helix domain-containing protein n=1 Tax=Alteromonas sp. D210916BOD_24 TaxID=3157618 RepID=UPI00399C52CD